MTDGSNNHMDLFVVSSEGQLFPRDIFHLTMSFIPAFPFYFMLRSVCRQWQSEFQDHLYAKVEHLNLVDDGKPKYYVRPDHYGQETLVHYQPIGLIGRNDPDGCDTRLFEILTKSFPNVKHLRLSFGSLSLSQFYHWLNIMLPKLTQLETLDVLGTNQAHFDNPDHSVLGEYELEKLACSLPISTKNLNFIGVTLYCDVQFLDIFSAKKATYRYSVERMNSLVDQRDIFVDIERLTLPYLFLLEDGYHDELNAHLEHVKQLFSHFEVSVVESLHNPQNLQAPVVSYIDYLNYMSDKEGIVLSHMRHNMRIDTQEILEATIDLSVREYNYFQPIHSVRGKKNVLLAPQTKLDAGFVVKCGLPALRVLELLTDVRRVKYPELVFNVDSTVVGEGDSTSSSLMSFLIAQCSNDHDLSMIKTIIETYKPSMAVNGVQNYLVEASNLPYSPIRTELMEHLLSLEPELITLGDLNGIISIDRKKDVPLIQIFLSRQYSEQCLEDVKFLVSSGASLTQVNNDGNTVLHSACRMVDINLVKYLLSVCPESLLYVRNKKEQTAMEQIFHNSRGIDILVPFLGEAITLPCFKDRLFKDYPTSCGNLLHAALLRPEILTLRWLLDKGFSMRGKTL